MLVSVYHKLLAQLAELIKSADQELSVCLYVNQGGTNHNRCTETCNLAYSTQGD